jgi:Spy/CpxP family protein refolding chaperone
MRISRSATPGLLFVLALAVSLSAFAQSQSNSSPSQSQPPQAAPSTPPAGQQNAPGNQASGQQQATEDNPLNLTEDQKAKLRPIIMEENQQMEALRNDTTMTQEQKIAKANQIRADASPKIKAILTPEQIQKLTELQEERARQQQQQQSQPPQSAPPSNSKQPPPK